jgi:mannose/cellobiose epimerase-like protein (N-acyl-D-glucosamine 2-epimerase family)
MSPAYTDPAYLRDRIVEILDFYYPTCVDEVRGGFVAQLDEETGEVYDSDTRHLVASSRFVVNFAVGDRLDAAEWCAEATERGVAFLHDHHRDEQRGGYHWILDGTEPVDSTRVAYGHAFALLAYARAVEQGVPGASSYLEETYDLLVDRFWEPEHELCRSQWDEDWTAADDYRGQNANMHTCEAMIAAHEATGEQRYLEKALAIAHSLTVRLAEETDGLLWEHYTADWVHDFEYNVDDKRHQFRPWGYQPGHHIEWAKLLATLARHSDDDWLTERAVELFDAAVEHGWDDERGGFVYTFDRAGDPVVEDKYGWPVAEGIGAAAALYERTGDDRFREWYERLWRYADEQLVAPGGNWYEKLSPAGEPRPVSEGTAVEPGYHPIGACFEGIRSFGD